jgi:hypothetical protein
MARLGPLKIYNIKDMALTHQEYLIKKNRRMLIAVSGDVGVGKSTLCYDYAKGATSWAAEKIFRECCVFEGPISQVFKEASEYPRRLPRYSPFWIDEGTDIANAQDWQNTFSKGFNSFLNKSRKVWLKREAEEPIRKGNNATLICMPDFQEFNSRIRRKFNRWVWIFEPGQALVFKKSNAPFGDNWRKDQMLDMFNTFLENNDIREDKVIFEDLIRIYSPLPNCLGVCYFPKMCEEEEFLYEQIHAEKTTGEPEELEEEGKRNRKLRLGIGNASLFLQNLANEYYDVIRYNIPNLSDRQKELLTTLETAKTLLGRGKIFGLSAPNIMKIEELTIKTPKKAKPI